MPKHRTQKVNPEHEDPHGLNPKQRLFVEEYILDLNGTQAAIRAGYAEVGASVHASRLLANAKVQRAIADGQKARLERLKASQDEVLVVLAHILRADLRHAIKERDGGVKRLDEMPRELTQALAAIEVEELFEGRGEDRQQVGFTKKLKLWDKTKAAELLLKNMGALKEKREVSLEKSFAELVLNSMKKNGGDA